MSTVNGFSFPDACVGSKGALLLGVCVQTVAQLTFYCCNVLLNHSFQGTLWGRGHKKCGEQMTTRHTCWPPSEREAQIARRQNKKHINCQTRVLKQQLALDNCKTNCQMPPEKMPDKLHTALLHSLFSLQTNAIAFFQNKNGS